MNNKIVGIIAAIVILAAGILLFAPKPEEKKIDPLGELVFIKADLPPELTEQYQKLFDAAKNDIQKDPGKYMAWIQIGQTKLDAGDYEGAERAWRHIAELKPDSYVAFRQLGYLYGYVVHDFPKAEAAYREVIKRDAGLADSYTSLYDIYRSWEGKESLAPQILLEGLQNLKDEPYLIAALARHYRYNNEIDKAIEYFEKLLAVDPQNQEAQEALKNLK